MKASPKVRIVLLVIGGIVFLGFVAWNLLWFAYVNQFKPYTEAVPKDKYGTYHIVDADGYSYNVKKPSYLSFTGNLGSVAPDDICSLIIWPKMSGGY